MYHAASPLTHTGDMVGSEDLKLLYYYHNRLQGYGQVNLIEDLIFR